tara:strand:- start:204 stop:368 length:165 start_codon:yes stop_codon:yes gene_type:complete
MKIILLLLIIFIVQINAVMIPNNITGAWEMISQYALGVWKYQNTTALLPTIPHS